MDQINSTQNTPGAPVGVAPQGGGMSGANMVIASLAMIVVVGVVGAVYSFLSRGVVYTWVAETNLLNSYGLQAVQDKEWDSYVLSEGVAYYRPDATSARQTVMGADAATFEAFGASTWAKDKDRVYYEGQARPIFDPATFEIVDGLVVKDANGVYMVDTFNRGKEQRVDLADPLTFMDAGECYGFGPFRTHYFMDQNHVFVPDSTDVARLVVLEAADAATFKNFGVHVDTSRAPSLSSYAKDKAHVYYACDKVLEDANAATFQPLTSSSAYAKDENHVYFAGKVLAGADAASMTLVGVGHQDEYAKDKARVYRDGVVIANADPATFVLLSAGSSNYAKDKARVYFMEQTLRGADLATFVVVKENIAKDKNHVYHDGVVEEGVEASQCTAESLDGCFGA